MKTTVEIEDELLVRAKRQAAQERAPLRKLIEAGLRHQIEQGRGSVRNAKARRRVRWVIVPGGVPEPGILKSRDRMYAWLNRHA